MNRTNVAGTWKNCTPYVNVAGGWKVASAFTNVGGTWKSSGGSTGAGGGPLTATPSDNIATGAAANNNTVSVRTQEITAAASGGSGTYTYQWTNGTHIHPENPTSATTRFAGSVPAGVEYNENFTCTVSDGTSSVTTSVVNADIQNYGRGTGGTL